MGQKQRTRKVPTLDGVQSMFSAAKSVDEFSVRSGLFNLLSDAQHTSDDLNDIIEALRKHGDYVHSDRARDLQERLRAAIAPLASLHSSAMAELMRQGKY